jgi:hypothetical protein
VTQHQLLKEREIGSLNSATNALVKQPIDFLPKIIIPSDLDRHLLVAEFDRRIGSDFRKQSFQPFFSPMNRATTNFIRRPNHSGPSELAQSLPYSWPLGIRLPS